MAKGGFIWAAIQQIECGDVFGRNEKKGIPRGGQKKG